MPVVGMQQRLDRSLKAARDFLSTQTEPVGLGTGSTTKVVLSTSILGSFIDLMGFFET